jgi:hypothetical protein
MLVRQALFHLSHTPSPFCFNYFSDRVSHFCPGPALDSDTLTHVSYLATITGQMHMLILPRLSTDCNLPISDCQAAEIIGVCSHI